MYAHPPDENAAHDLLSGSAVDQPTGLRTRPRPRPGAPEEGGMSTELVSRSPPTRKVGAADSTLRLVLTLAVAGFLSGLAIVRRLGSSRGRASPPTRPGPCARLSSKVVPGGRSAGAPGRGARRARLAPRSTGRRGPAASPRVYGGYATDGSPPRLSRSPGDRVAGYPGHTISLLYGYRSRCAAE